MQVPDSKPVLFFADDTPLFYHFNTMAKRYYGLMDEEFKDIDIERYYFILSLICKQKNIKQQFLCNCLKIDKASMVRVIDYLTRHDYIMRIVNPDDRREHIIIPTEKALSALPHFENAFRKLNDECLKDFSAVEKDKFYRMMERVVDNLSAASPDNVFLKINKSKIQ
ncbi:MAG: MarR family transcriptional regulator [Bacteroidota bacterium]